MIIKKITMEEKFIIEFKNSRFSPYRVPELKNLGIFCDINQEGKMDMKTIIANKFKDRLINFLS